MAILTGNHVAHRRSSGGWQVPLAVALAVWCVGQVAPLLSPLILALAVGVIFANTSPARSAAVATAASPARFMLRLGVALLGLRLALSDIAQVGLLGAAMVLVTVAGTFTITRLVGRRMGLEPEFVSLIASGFAVCGAAAIAAVQDNVRAKENHVGLALALVTIHGTVMLAAIPLLGDFLGLDQVSVSMWAGASIHEVAQVAAAAAMIGPGAVAIAMSVKLGRVLMLAPIHQAVSRLHHDGGKASLHDVPWFLYAFVAAVAIRATGVLPDDVLTGATHASTILLAAGMFGLGLGIVVKDLWPIPGRAVALSIVATLTVTTIPLAMLMLLGPA